MNADECIARGCALMAAILSPAYKVRDFQVEDKVPHGVTITWMGSKTDTTEADKDGDEPMQDANEAAVLTYPNTKVMTSLFLFDVSVCSSMSRR